MAGEDQTGGLDLSGVWQGRYFYPRRRAPVAFAATLTEVGGWLDGTVKEKGAAGAARGRVITASLQGRRNARSITFLKLYHGDYAEYDSVHYEGEVCDEGSKIAGRWNIPGGWSGTFVMTRAGTAAKAKFRKAAEKV